MTATVYVSCPVQDTTNSFFIVAEKIKYCIKNEYRLVDEPSQDVDIHIHVGTPERSQESIYQRTAKKFVFYSFAESTKIPARWSDHFNKADEIWVPSNFVKESFTNSAVTVPIHVIQLGIADNGGLIPASEGNEYTILWQGNNLRAYDAGREVDGDRKGGRVVEEAFVKANIPNSRLILKYIPTTGVEYEFKVDPIWYICKRMSPEEIGQIDKMIDLFVWPTRGEGFGLVPLEKLSRGIPSICTYWSGPLEYLDDFDLPRLYPTRLGKVIYNEEECEMAEFDVNYLGDKLTECYERRGEFKSKRAEFSSNAETWGFENRMKSKLLDRISNIV